VVEEECQTGYVVRINEGWSKSFQTGAAICTAVVLAPSSGRW